MARSRILIITRNLPPLVGGMERLNWHMADELSKYAEVKVIGPKGAATIKPQHVELHEAPLKPLPLFLMVAFCKTLWLSLLWRPDITLAGSGLTAPLAWLSSKLSSSKSAVYLHGFDITVKNNLYQRFWPLSFKKMDTIIVNSTPTKKLAVSAGLDKSKIAIVHPGVSLPEAPQTEEDIDKFKAQHNLTNKKVLLSVGRLTTRKGLREFVELALPKIVQTVPNAILVVIGEAPKNSLGASIQTVESILTLAKQSGVDGNIKFLGVITDKVQLATAYETADVHVFPVRHIPDDPEGFGMVAIEAAAHGLPTIAFATGGIIDAVQQGKSGYLIETNNYTEMSKKITELLRQPALFNEIKDFSSSFSWSNFGNLIHNALTKNI
ncbi:glycosyltransferase family 4 protein [Aestuariicella sp. G3-2]|uniref:glycosyltransferase family 4 protein n=1 Tax=Pseudomaricurvus albidus TaxID=2842452 RepID=UPI001C0E57A6|nr:glycosyltransferase family 4 protein [Aestuariicella albida]MBU3071033.1 glycosyltransferase family 4 protein [Aestuariicella albida]